MGKIQGDTVYGRMYGGSSRAYTAGCATHGRESFANGCTTIGFDPDRAYAVVPRCMVDSTVCRDTNLTALAISVQLYCGRGPGQVSLGSCLNGGGRLWGLGVCHSVRRVLAITLE